MYTVRDSKGNVYTFHDDQHELDEFSEVTDTTVIPDDFRTVAKWPLDDGIGVAFGQGNSKNPDRAEAYFYLDPKDDSSTPVDIAGFYRFVVLNSAGEPVGTIFRGRIGRARNGDPDTDSRGDWGTPFPYQSIRKGKGEVLGEGGYQIGLQLQTTDSQGQIAFSLANSDMLAEGYRGTKQT